MSLALTLEPDRVTDDLAASASPVREDRAAIDKAVSLLLAFGQQSSTGVGVSELARRTRLSKSTAYRVLGMLERNGVVERVGRQYRLGARLHDLGRHVYSPEHDRIRDQLIPFLTELYELTHQTVHLAALHGIDVVYLAKLYGHRRVATPSQIGGRAPAHCTAVGKAMLAHDAEAFEHVLDSDLVAMTPMTVTDPAVLAAVVAQVRRTGVAYDLEEARPGLHCVASPVLNAGGRPVAALSVSVSCDAEIRRVEPMLRQVSANASHFMARQAGMVRSRVS